MKVFERLFIIQSAEDLLIAILQRKYLNYFTQKSYQKLCGVRIKIFVKKWRLSIDTIRIDESQKSVYKVIHYLNIWINADTDSWTEII